MSYSYKKEVFGKNKIFEVPTTISETIYRYLRKAIIEGDLRPDQRIHEKEIAEIFNVSTTPVREAFQKLSAEKYLIIDARKEVVVASATLEEIKELFEIVRLLDAFAVKKALKELSDKKIEEIKEMTKNLGNFYRQKKIQSYVKENLKIHDKLWSACGNKFIYQSLVNLAEKSTFFGNQMFFLAAEQTKNPSIFDKSYKDHTDLMEAIEKRDGEAVEKILLSHWGKGFLDREDDDLEIKN
jgi:DNA-binding GntR family transcriptional regulator